MFKKGLVLALFFLLLLSGCNNTKNTDDITQKSIKSSSGLEDIEVIQNEYFDALKGVSVIGESDQDITYLMTVTGHVDYGKVGTYALNYDLTYGEDTIHLTRNVTVKTGTINRTTFTRNTNTTASVNLEAGSYKTTSDATIAHPVNPNFINADLLNKAVPSNGWWTSLLVSNYGGGNGIYTNPLRTAFSNSGAEITNPGSGFVQYWNPDGYNTMANFSLALPDLFLKASSLNEGYLTQVVGYSDTSVNVALRNASDLKDHMVLTYTQGSPYVFAELMNGSYPKLNVNLAGITGIEYYSVNGTQITDSYTGNGLVIKLVHKHVGYETSRPASVGQALYSDRFFLVSTPGNTLFSITNNNISITLGSSNYLSIASLESLSDASFFREHAFNKTLKGNVSYVVDEKSSVVDTNYHLSTQKMDENTLEPIQYLMPHQYLNNDITLLDYQTVTVRGTLKLFQGNDFNTKLSFNGLLPSMTLPNDSSFDEADMSTYLSNLAMDTVTTDTSNFLNAEGPYWNSKAIYPLSQGIIIADQMGSDSMRDDLIARLEYLMNDWFTYSGIGDDKYLYYNETWGSVYYSNNDFGTASELSDHAFTHGYLIYAAAILSMYDENFYSNYKGVIELLLNDYLTYDKTSYNFAYLRSFDPWAGHTWAHGFGTFAEGNNIESSSEAIQSWVAGYLWALQKGDKALRDAAIYGFVHEVYTSKIYRFDYENVVLKDEYSDYAAVVGMIWGGKYDYATWFGANPTFIYGIQWLPNGEYLSSYALTDIERTKLDYIFSTYLDSKNGVIDTWFSSMWSIQALLDPSAAIEQFNASKILNDDYPDDLAQTYYLIHGLNSYGVRTTDYYMELSETVTSSIYTKDSHVYALVWNPSNSKQEITFHTVTGKTINKTVTANSFVTITLK